MNGIDLVSQTTDTNGVLVGYGATSSEFDMQGCTVLAVNTQGRRRPRVRRPSRRSKRKGNLHAPAHPKHSS